MSADKAIKSGDTIVSLPRTAALLVTPKMKNPFPHEIDTAYWSKCQWSAVNPLLFLHVHHLMVAASLVMLPKMHTKPFLCGNGQ